MSTLTTEHEVLQVRIRSLLGYIHGMLKHIPIRKLPENLQRVKSFVEEETFGALYPGVRESSNTGHHSYVLVEVLSNDAQAPMSLDNLHYAITDGDYSGEVSETRDMLLPRYLMEALLEAQGSSSSFLFFNEPQKF